LNARKKSLKRKKKSKEEFQRDCIEGYFKPRAEKLAADIHKMLSEITRHHNVEPWKEIDALIAGCGKKVATSLQLLKETGMRIGEARNLEWIDIDNENRTVICTPEKHGTPRQLRVSKKLITMLNALPHNNIKVFENTNMIAHGINFRNQRKRLAKKLQNPRLLKISFHSLRHWRATTEYHRTKDILHVKEMLGHRGISSTLIYTHLVKFESDDYYVKTTKTLKEACELAEVGFTYFTEIQGVQVFRKPK